MNNAKSIKLATFREMADEDCYLQDAKPAVQHVRLHACREMAGYGLTVSPVDLGHWKLFVHRQSRDQASSQNSVAMVSCHSLGPQLPGQESPKVSRCFLANIPCYFLFD